MVNINTDKSRFKWKYRELAMKISAELCVHINGESIGFINDEVFPQETESNKLFRNRIYQPITQAYFGDALNALSRIFNSANHKIKPSDAISEYVDGYICIENGIAYDFYTWLEQIVVQYMICDPNAVFVVLPEGLGLKDVTKEVDCAVYIFPSSDIYDAGTNFFELVIEYADEYNEQPKRILRITDVSVTQWLWNDTTKEFQIEPDYGYVHNIGKVPADFLGGNVIFKKGCYRSFFSDAVPAANEFALLHSNAIAVTVTYARPLFIGRKMQCSAKGCVDGRIIDEFHNPTLAKPKCRVCNGSGYISVLGQGSLSTIEMPEGELGEMLNVDNVAKYVEVPVDIIDRLLQREENAEKRLLKALKTETVDAAQSGVAKSIDRESEDSTLMRISSELFRIAYNCLWYIECYRVKDVNDREKPVVQPPKRFRLESKMEILEELRVLREAGADMYQIKELLKDYVEKRFTGDSDIVAKDAFLMYYDVLFANVFSEVSFLWSTGAVDKITFQRHLYGGTYIDEYAHKFASVEIVPDNYERIATELDKWINERHGEQTMMSFMESLPKEEVDLEEEDETELEDEIDEIESNDNEGETTVNA